MPEHSRPSSPPARPRWDQVFGEEGTQKVGDKAIHNFHIGAPLDMENVKVTLNLERLVERSSGVFGKSGTGKTFLSRLLLAGVIRDSVAVNLIFDMHNEYGWAGTRRPGRPGQGLEPVVPRQGGYFHAG